jgi:MFS family permease
MFYCSSAFGFFSIAILLGIKETLNHKNPFSTSMLKIKKHDIFEKRVIIPCVIMLLTAYSYGAFLTIIPDFSEHIGIKNKGILLGFFTTASLVVRAVGGRASDKYGRKNIVKLSSILIFVAMIIVGLAKTPIVLFVGITIYGLGQGMTSPTLLAWATDLSDEKHRGKGLASLYMFMELGIGIGALLSAQIYRNVTANFIYTFFLCGVLSIIAFVFLIFIKPRIKTQV